MQNQEYKLHHLLLNCNYTNSGDGINVIRIEAGNRVIVAQRSLF